MIEDLENLTKNGWEKSADGVAIKKTFIFPDFIEALGWMVKAGVCAEKLNHHPEWRNVYKTVDVLLTTHDEGSITILDIKLAQKWISSTSLEVLQYSFSARPSTTPEASSR